MTDDTKDLASLPAERLVEMLREKRQAEADVRARLREVEAERDTLSERVTAWQDEKLQEIARAAKVAVTALPDLAQYIQIGDHLAEDGRLDPEKTAAAFDALKESKPHLFDIPRIAATNSNGVASPMGEAPRTPPASWSDVLSPE